jgi:hypothetical protein
MGDGWHHHSWHRWYSPGVGSLYEFCRGIYIHENPRIGQVATLLSYTPGPYHSIVTPIVELSVLAMLTVLALGRWPSIRRSRDALVAALIAAVLVICTPQIGPLLFYRPFTGNYVFSLALNLLWLVPYRLEVAAARPWRAWLAPLMAVLGVAAGLGNEHTGLAFLAMGGLATVVAARRSGVRGWMVAGLVGLAVGYFLLLTAPGQQMRYLGLAKQASIVERITERGVAGNLRVLGALALAMAPALVLLGIGLVERWTAGASLARERLARWVPAVVALAGVACMLTLLASPKIGPRLYFASVALVAAGLVGWLAAQLRSLWAHCSCAILAAAALVYVEARFIAAYRVVGPLGAVRLERLERAAPGSVVTVPRYPVPPSRYFLGDDFFVSRRESVAGEYHLQAVELEPGEP